MDNSMGNRIETKFYGFSLGIAFVLFCVLSLFFSQRLDHKKEKVLVDSTLPNKDKYFVVLREIVTVDFPRTIVFTCMKMMYSVCKKRATVMDVLILAP